MNVADLAALRTRLERAIADIDRMTADSIAERTEIEPDAYSAGGIEAACDSLSEAVEIETPGFYEPIEVTAYAIVRRFWAVRIPFGDEEGNIEGDEIMRFETKAEADAYAESMTSDPPGNS